MLSVSLAASVESLESSFLAAIWFPASLTDGKSCRRAGDAADKLANITKAVATEYNILISVIEWLVCRSVVRCSVGLSSLLVAQERSHIVLMAYRLAAPIGQWYT